MAVWNMKTKGEEDAIKSFTEESDRSVAIIAAVFLENRLEYELKQQLRHDDAAKKTIAELFHMSGPVGTFASKIRLGFALRLYGKRVFRELVTIKDIRNEFAHVIGESAIHSFTEQPIRDWCSNLKIIENYVRPMSEMPPDFFSPTNVLPPDESKRRSGILYYDSPPPHINLRDPRRRYIETCGLFAERFDGSGRFLIIGDEPEPLP